MRDSWVIAKYTLSLFLRRRWIALFFVWGLVFLFAEIRWVIETGAAGGVKAILHSGELWWRVRGAQASLEALAVTSALVCGIAAIHLEDRASTLDLFFVRAISTRAFFFGKVMGTMVLVTLISVGTAIGGLLLVMATGVEVAPVFWLSILQRVSQVCLVSALALLVGASRSVLVAGIALVVLTVVEAQAITPTGSGSGVVYWARIVIALLLPAPNTSEPFLVAFNGVPIVRYGHHLAVFLDNFLYSAFLVLLGAELFARRATRPR